MISEIFNFVPMLRNDLPNFFQAFSPEFVVNSPKSSQLIDGVFGVIEFCSQVIGVANIKYPPDQIPVAGMITRARAVVYKYLFTSSIVFLMPSSSAWFFPSNSMPMYPSKPEALTISRSFL